MGDFGAQSKHFWTFVLICSSDVSEIAPKNLKMYVMAGIKSG